MTSICFYFQVHQPYRIKKYRVFDIGERSDYFSDGSESNLNNERILKKVAHKCYIPANKIILEIIKKHPEFKVSYSITGVVLEQFEKYSPEVIDSFRELIKTGNVEILAETYYHSLAFLYSKEEFIEQIKLHENKIKKIFNVTPKIFRNTELIYSNALAQTIAELGYKGMLAEGVDRILEWRSPNFIYTNPKKNIKLLLKNYKLSDDIAFRFSEKTWNEWPLTAEKYAAWLNKVEGDTLNLFMDYETFGEHQWEDTGIFHFLYALPDEILKNKRYNFKTPSELIESFPAVSELNIPEFISWADVDRDLSAWLSNAMQKAAMQKLYEIKNEVLLSKDNELIDSWRKMQTSDHFYYMCTKWFSDGDVHKYFNPYESPYDAFISYMNALNDLKLRVEEKIRNIYKES